GVVTLELGEAQVTERRPQSPMRARCSRSRRPAPTVTTGCTRRREDLNPLATSRVITVRASHMSSPRFRAALPRWVVAWIRASGPVMGWVGPILGTCLRASAGYLLRRLLPCIDRGYKWYVDTSRLVPSRLKHSGRLGPLACQVEIFVTLSGIYGYLGR